MLFVGVPLLTALVLMAAPLHDATPPPAQEVAAAALAGEEAIPNSPSVESRREEAARRRAVSRPQRNESEPVPAVIYETRRTIHRPYQIGRPAISGSVAVSGAAAVTPADSAAVWRPSMPATMALPAVVKRPESRATAGSLESQSP